MRNTMTKEDILWRLHDAPEVEIFEQTEKTVLVYDCRAGNDILYSFAEFFTLQQLQEKITVLSCMPACARLDVPALAVYLWETMDHNAFLTLDRLWIVNQRADYKTIAEYYHDEDATTLVGDNILGCMWYRHQACIVDVPNILKHISGKAKKFCGISHYDIQKELRREIVVTIVHELRHLMLDTNIVLSMEEYPLAWGEEFFVDRYAYETCEDAEFSMIFINEEECICM